MVLRVEFGEVTSSGEQDYSISGEERLCASGRKVYTSIRVFDRNHDHARLAADVQVSEALPGERAIGSDLDLVHFNFERTALGHQFCELDGGGVSEQGGHVLGPDGRR